MAERVEIDVVANDLATPTLKSVAGGVNNLTDTEKKLTASTKDNTKAVSDNKSMLGNLVGGLNLAIDPVSLLVKGLYLLRDAAMASAQAYAEAEVVNAQLNAVLQSTKNIAGLTSDELNALADSLSSMSGADDEAILRGEALLLTFTKIGKDVFPEATEAALNMSMAMGTDLQSAIIQVGKALNEPIEGVSALRRVGVQLTDAQQEQVKAFMDVNDIASAQKIILNELAVEFGGVAEAMGDTTTGSANKLKVAWGNLMETMGEDSAGVWKSTNEALTKIVIGLNDTLDATQEFNEEIKRTNLNTEEWGRGYKSVILYDEAVRDAIATVEKADWAAGEKGYNSLSESADNATDSILASAEAIEKTEQSILKIALSGTLDKSYDKYVDTLEGLQDKHEELQEELGKVAWSYGDNTQKVIDLTAKIQEMKDAGADTEKIEKYEQKLKAVKMVYDESVPAAQKIIEKINENKAAQDEAAEAMHRATTEMIYQQASAGLDAESNLALARAMGMIDEESYAAAIATQALKDKYDAGLISSNEYAKKVAALRDRINELQDKNVTITLTTIQNTVSNLMQQGVNPYVASQYANKHAAGGDFMIPQSYGNEGFRLGNNDTASGGELISITPRGEKPNSGVNVVLNYSTVMSFGNEAEMRSRLIPVIIQGVQEAKAQGKI